MATAVGLDSFTWQDGERTIRFGRGAAAEAVGLLGGPGYILLTTERAAGMAPGVADAAAAVHHVAGGLVDEIAAGLLGEVAGAERIVALGGGRVIDTAKALAAAGGGRAMAVPTTLSGAEMTRGHRLPTGVEAARVRCAAVVNDPALSASQPVDALAASALNALGHAVEAPCTPRANPVATLAALRSAELMAGAFAAAGPDRDALALGALLAGYSIDSAGYGLHHVLAQTLVRVAGAGHGPANAILLPHTIGALAWRFPRQHDALAAALGEDPAEAASRLRELTGTVRLQDVGLRREDLVACADAAAERSELDSTPPRAGRAELLALLEHAC
ncbi:MAG: iron-containing alcohol dehydrogenase [Actinomycetota bacterium]|nr:iron-containing alcohol dehydrogenase [Actinomycetota bacterium]